MGTSGNRNGYKVFSINTTVRNPQRNIEFLWYFRKFNGFIFDEKIKNLYFVELVKNGVYTFRNLSPAIKEKLLNDIELNEIEIKELLEKNPQKTGFAGRVMTQLRALKDQNLLCFSGKETKPKIELTQLALDLLDNRLNIADTYSKILLGLHAKNPTRTSTFNQSRPFLNFIFVMDLLRQNAKQQKKEFKGILKHEFKVFVLGMKDCNYKDCAKQILLYRNRFGKVEDKKYLQNYLFKELNLLPLKYNSLNDYADEVFRKFKMSNLVIERGVFKNIYYDFSQFNYVKIQTLLKKYRNYKFKTFVSQEEYNNFIYNIDLPWINDNNIKEKVIKQKAKNLNTNLKELKNLNLNDLEAELDRKFYSKILNSVVEKCEFSMLLNELKILANLSNEKSKYNDLPEPLRLEYILALIMAKKFGNYKIQSNLIYDENGIPLSFAPAGKIDLEFENFIIEATMIRNRNQQLNSETTSIARHMQQKEQQENTKLRTMLIAPLIHFDVALFFKFCAKEFKSKIAPLSIKHFIVLIKKSTDLEEFKSKFDGCVKDLLNRKTQDYIENINRCKG